MRCCAYMSCALIFLRQCGWVLALSFWPPGQSLLWLPGRLLSACFTLSSLSWRNRPLTWPPDWLLLPFYGHMAGSVCSPQQMSGCLVAYSVCGPWWTSCCLVVCILGLMAGSVCGPQLASCCLVACSVCGPWQTNLGSTWFLMASCAVLIPSLRCNIRSSTRKATIFLEFSSVILSSHLKIISSQDKDSWFPMFELLCPRLSVIRRSCPRIFASFVKNTKIEVSTYFLLLGLLKLWATMAIFTAKSRIIYDAGSLRFTKTATTCW